VSLPSFGNRWLLGRASSRLAGAWPDGPDHRTSDGSQLAAFVPDPGRWSTWLTDSHRLLQAIGKVACREFTGDRSGSGVGGAGWSGHSFGGSAAEEVTRVVRV
jgi:hypothetical protein